MNALIISGGNIDISFAREYINNYDYDYLVVADQGLETTEALGLNPDLIVGDFDSVDPALIHRYETDPKSVESVLRFKAQKDYTDTQIAVERAVKYGVSHIEVLGATGDRLDHVLGNIAVMKYALRWDATMSIVDANNRITMIDKSLTISKKDQYGKYVSVIPYSGEAKGVTLTGFAYNVEDETFYDDTSLGVSNEIADETARIEVKEGLLLIVESDRLKKMQ